MRPEERQRVAQVLDGLYNYRIRDGEASNMLTGLLDSSPNLSSQPQAYDDNTYSIANGTSGPNYNAAFPNQLPDELDQFNPTFMSTPNQGTCNNRAPMSPIPQRQPIPGPSRGPAVVNRPSGPNYNPAFPNRMPEVIDDFNPSVSSTPNQTDKSSRFDFPPMSPIPQRQPIPGPSRGPTVTYRQTGPNYNAGFRNQMPDEIDEFNPSFASTPNQTDNSTRFSFESPVPKLQRFPGHPGPPSPEPTARPRQLQLNPVASHGFIPNTFSPTLMTSGACPRRGPQRIPETGRGNMGSPSPMHNRSRRVSATTGKPLCSPNLDQTQFGKRDLSRLYGLPNNQNYVFPGNDAYSLPPDHVGPPANTSKASDQVFKVNTDAERIIGNAGEDCGIPTSNRLPSDALAKRNLVQSYTLPNNERYIYPHNESYTLPNNGDVMNTTGASSEPFVVNPINPRSILGGVDESPCDACDLGDEFNPSFASTPNETSNSTRFNFPPDSPKPGPSKRPAKLPQVLPGPATCGKSKTPETSIASETSCLNCGAPELDVPIFGRRTPSTPAPVPGPSTAPAGHVCKGPNCSTCAAPDLSIRIYTPQGRPTFAERIAPKPEPNVNVSGSSAPAPTYRYAAPREMFNETASSKNSSLNQTCPYVGNDTGESLCFGDLLYTDRESQARARAAGPRRPRPPDQSCERSQNEDGYGDFDPSFFQERSLRAQEPPYPNMRDSQIQQGLDRARPYL